MAHSPLPSGAAISHTDLIESPASRLLQSRFRRSLLAGDPRCAAARKRQGCRASIIAVREGNRHRLRARKDRDVNPKSANLVVCHQRTYTPPLAGARCIASMHRVKREAGAKVFAIRTFKSGAAPATVG